MMKRKCYQPGLTQSFWQPLKQQSSLPLQSVSFAHISPRRSHSPSLPSQGLGHWPGFVSAFLWTSDVFTHICWQPLKQHFWFPGQWKSIPHSSPILSQKPVSPFHGVGQVPSFPFILVFAEKIGKHIHIIPNGWVYAGSMRYCTVLYISLSCKGRILPTDVGGYYGLRTFLIYRCLITRGKTEIGAYCIFKFIWYILNSCTIFR